MTKIQEVLKKALESGVDGGNSNAYNSVVNLLKYSKKGLGGYYSVKLFSLKDLEIVLEYLAARWDKEIDQVIFKK